MSKTKTKSSATSVNITIENNLFAKNKFPKEEEAQTKQGSLRHQRGGATPPTPQAIVSSSLVQPSNEPYWMRDIRQAMSEKNMYSIKNRTRPPAYYNPAGQSVYNSPSPGVPMGSPAPQSPAPSIQASQAPQSPAQSFQAPQYPAQSFQILGAPSAAITDALSIEDLYTSMLTEHQLPWDTPAASENGDDEIAVDNEIVPALDNEAGAGPVVFFDDDAEYIGPPSQRFMFENKRNALLNGEKTNFPREDVRKKMNFSVLELDIIYWNMKNRGKNPTTYIPSTPQPH